MSSKLAKMMDWSSVRSLIAMMAVISVPLFVTAKSLPGAAVPEIASNPVTHSPVDSFEAAMVSELNRARTNPVGYADWLATLRPRYNGAVLQLPEEGRIRMIEGVTALDDAIAALRQQSPLPPLQRSNGMSRGARDRLTPSATTASTTVGDRLRQYGVWEGRLAEVSTFANRTAAIKVALLILNDGNASRPLRRQIFSPEFRYVGVACSTQRERTCVLNYVSDYREGTVPVTATPQPATAPGATTAPLALTVQPGRPAQQPSAITAPHPTPSSATRPAAIAASPTPTAPNPAASPTTSPSVRAERIPTVMVAIAQTPHLTALERATYLSPLEREIIAETNRLRANPSAYADELEHLLQYYEGKMLRMPGLPPYETIEGAVPVREAIATLRRTRSLPLLTASRGMSQGANDHALDLSARNAAGHYSTNGHTHAERIGRYGTWQNSSENISLSPFESARWHILQLLIDDGVPNRGHRRALLRPEYRATGAGCEGHPSFASVCVMTYAERYTER